jgi:predicted nucleotidyltransferase
MDLTTDKSLTTDRRLARVVQRLVEAYRPRRGSTSSGRRREEIGALSDYDLMVVVGDDASPERRRSRLSYQRLWGTGIAADVLVWTQTRFDSRLHRTP